ncbi:MAG: flagellar export chaperone FlgN [Opitutae bacterium]|nr:flagellar export chaperone FlgN [Opitutae bacterium]
MNANATAPVNWPEIVEALRAELAEYGGLLALFDEQQRALFAREAGEVLRLSAVIERQVGGVSRCRQRRESLVALLARALGQPDRATLRSLLPLIEPTARPLLEALIAEVNRLLHRVRRQNRQNHLLLSRTVSLHQETLAQLRPQAFTQTYTPAGRVQLASNPTASTLRAAG